MTAPAIAQSDELTPTQVRLLTTAERLFAEKGLDSVSTREIAREAGQKNHSALQYHFGDRDRLIAAILDFRMIPLNERRLEMLDALERERRTDDVRALVEALVRPFVEVLFRSNPGRRLGHVSVWSVG